MTGSVSASTVVFFWVRRDGFADFDDGVQGTVDDRIVAQTFLKAFHRFHQSFRCWAGFEKIVGRERNEVTAPIPCH